jgi:molybdopterin-guanine dinucleotide biosynthesis protein B
MKIFSVVGWSGSGKTTLITRLIFFFKAKKKTVAVLKNVPHAYSLQPEGKDSYKFLDAGADQVYLSGQGEIIRMQRREKGDEVLDMIIPELQHVDVLILEGLIRKGIPAIEVYDSTGERKPKFPPEILSAVISREKMALSIPCFHPDDFEDIAKFMEEKANE